jgi:hypothetical protein
MISKGQATSSFLREIFNVKRVLNFLYARGIRSIIHVWNEFSNIKMQNFHYILEFPSRFQQSLCFTEKTFLNLVVDLVVKNEHLEITNFYNYSHCHFGGAEKLSSSRL